MIGYAPFLGHVRLVGHSHLGQKKLLSEQDVAIEASRMAELLSRLESWTFDAKISPDVRQASLDKINECRIMLPEARIRADIENIYRCVLEVYHIQGYESPPVPATKEEEAERKISEYSPEPTIPTWAYVMGGLAAAGVVGWLVFGK
jgi:hypothetical protein